VGYTVTYRSETEATRLDVCLYKAFGIC
jgi:hypothetical protein